MFSHDLLTLKRMSDFPFLGHTRNDMNLLSKMDKSFLVCPVKETQVKMLLKF